MPFSALLPLKHENVLERCYVLAIIGVGLTSRLTCLLGCQRPRFRALPFCRTSGIGPRSGERNGSMDRKWLILASVSHFRRRCG